MRRGAAAGFRRLLRPPHEQQRQREEATSDRPRHLPQTNKSALDFAKEEKSIYIRGRAVLESSS